MSKRTFSAEAVGRLESEKAAIHAEYEQVPKILKIFYAKYEKLTGLKASLVFLAGMWNHFFSILIHLNVIINLNYN